MSGLIDSAAGVCNLLRPRLCRHMVCLLIGYRRECLSMCLRQDAIPISRENVVHCAVNPLVDSVSQENYA